MRKRKVDTAYYAHSIRIYNSKLEKEEFDFINNRCKGKVICPNKELGELGDIKKYLEVVKSCKEVYISEYGGMIGKGVFAECKTALKENIPVYIIRKDIDKKFYVLEVKDVERTEYHDFVRYGIVKTK